MSKPNLKKKLSNWLHSLANKLESEPKEKRPVQERKPLSSNRSTSQSLLSQSIQEPEPASSGRSASPVLLSEPTQAQPLPSPKPSGFPFILSRSNFPKTYLPFHVLQARLFSLLGTDAFQRLKALRRHPRFWLWMGIGAGLGSSAIAVGWGVVQIESSVPKSVNEIFTYARPGTITIKGADGTVLQEIGPVTHEKLKIWQIGDPVLKAFIASEDRRFEDHKGVDPQGILRAVFSNLKAGDVVEGGSTITQQLSRIVFLSQERSYTRKLAEMRIAHNIEQKYSKSQILERYLNLVYLGSGAYGIGDAAWVYFSKPASQLTLAEAATLAGIVPAPSLYSPLENPKAAKERRDIVLQLMQEEGFISAEEAKLAIALPLTVNPSPLQRLQRKAPYFTDYVQRELPKYVKKDVMQSGGIVVETTLNPQWQEAAETVIERTTSTYGRWQSFRQAALVSIDPRTGQIKAMVGGDDFEKNQYNRVTQAKRQPGSTFKTFVYTTAIAAGFSPNRGVLDAEYTVDGYKPENFGDKYSGAYISMRQALASSINVVAVRTLIDVGWNPVINVAHKMGIEAKLYPTYSLALGASEVNLLELTSAYGTLANQGVHQKPYGIGRVLDRNGNVLYQTKSQPEEALDKETTAIMTWMLTGVVNGGTGGAAQIGRPVAGKTGTSDKARDLWFVGYIPQLVTGVWLGNDNNQPTWGASTTAAMTWRQYMLTPIEEIEYEGFPPLPNRIDGRKPVIKAEPIKPRSSFYTMPKREPETAKEQPSRSRRYRQTGRRAFYQPPSQTRTYVSRSNTAPVKSSQPSAPVQAAVPIEVIQPTTASVPIPVAPPSDVAPPAPPAERKGE